MDNTRLARAAWALIIGGLLLVAVSARAAFADTPPLTEAAGPTPTVDAERMALAATASVPAPTTVPTPSAPRTPPAPPPSPTAPPTAEPTATPMPGPLDRLQIPAIGLDRPVIPMTWTVAHDALGPYQAWEVPVGAVGHHADSAQPGTSGNIVLSGHVAGRDPIFPRLIELVPGDDLTLWQGPRPRTYRVEAVHRVQEEGAPVAEQQHNASFLAPTDTERLTLITCWPPTGPDAFRDRILVVALPTTDA